VFGKSSEPLADSSDADGGKVADCDFVVSGRNGSVSFESVDAALHGVTLLADLALEGWRPATGRTTPEPMADLIAGLADGTPGYRVGAVQRGCRESCRPYQPRPDQGGSWSGRVKT
jgi:hypothetical protein